MKIRQLLLLELHKNSLPKLIVNAIVFLFYFDSMQIRISFIIFLGIFDSVCHLRKLQLVVFLRFCYMDVITPGFLGPSQNVQYMMKKSLCPCAKKVPETFFPRLITPRYHSFAAWVSNTSLIKVKTAILRVLSKNKIHQRLKPATQCCFEKKK